jgi:hypothetical protein
MECRVLNIGPDLYIAQYKKFLFWRDIKQRFYSRSDLPVIPMIFKTVEAAEAELLSFAKDTGGKPWFVVKSFVL